jgi:hypothetical protein
MKSRDLRRYERELTEAVRGLRAIRAVKLSFRALLAPLLEEDPDPSYETLAEALGPPEQLAFSLLQDSSCRPWTRRKKALLAVGICAIVLVSGLLRFAALNGPESGSFLPDAESLTYLDFPSSASAAQETFRHGDLDWDQSKDFRSYVLLLHNTNTVVTNVIVRYSNYQDPHTFSLAPGESAAFVVNEPRHTRHVISFDTPDGSLDGTVSILLSEDPIQVPAS